MNFYALSGLSNALTATALGLFVYLRSPRDQKHWVYGLYCCTIAVWSYFYFAWHIAETRDLALLYSRLLMAGAIMIPALYFHHTLTILDLVKRHRMMLQGTYALSLIFQACNLSPLFIKEVQARMSFPYWPVPGLAFHFYILWFTGLVIYASYLMLAAYRKATGLRRNQYQYLLMGSLIGYMGGATNFPLWYSIPVPPIGTILVSGYIAMVAYALIRYRLFDLTVALERGVNFLFLLIVTGVPSFGVLLLTQRYYFGTVSYSFSVLLLGLLALVIIGAYKIQTEAQTAISRTLFRSRYDRYETLSHFSKSLVNILDLRSLTEEIVHTLAAVLGIRTASLFILDKEKGTYMQAASYPPLEESGKHESVPVSHPLPHQLTCTQATLVREELEHAGEPRQFQSLLPTLKQLGAEVCIPLINKDRLIGFCNLGTRVRRRMYTDEELNLLTALAQNAAIALDNALLYEDVRRSQLLMRRTDRLRSLETIAGGFAHEIRNPLTSIKTFIQLAPDRKDEPDFMGQFGKVVAEDVDRIERLIQEILDYARYMEPKFTEEDLNEVVASCLYFVEVKAGSKSIALEKALAPDLPHVRLDRQQMKQVLLNLFLNAMEAIGERGGRLAVRTHRLVKADDQPWVQIEVSDTGPGIQPADLEHIFDPFYTTKHESGSREGTGLGLTIVHQIVQEHGGYIDVNSQVGRGTTFWVNIPAKPQPLALQAAHEAADPAET